MGKVKFNPNVRYSAGAPQYGTLNNWICPSCENEYSESDNRCLNSGNDNLIWCSCGAIFWDTPHGRIRLMDVSEYYEKIRINA